MHFGTLRETEVLRRTGFGLEELVMIASCLTRAAVLVLALVAVLSVERSAHAQILPPGPKHPWLALDVEGGVASLPRTADWTFLGRVGAGLSLIDRYYVRSFALQAMTLGRGKQTIGLGAEMNAFASGLGASAAAMISLDGEFGASAGCSFSVLHLEAQVHATEPVTAVVALTIRAPLGLIGYALWAPKDR